MSAAYQPPPSPPPPPPPQPTARKFPPYCWTQDETHVLIEAYRDRWYALSRSNLRAADWDAVSATVARRCPLALPPKSPVQCRHKMEKLRKRYRSEKQRSVANPGRFFSSWILFRLMESLENGSSLAHPDRGGREVVDFGGGGSSGFSVKAFSDLVSVPPGFPAKKIVKVEKNSDHFFYSGCDSGTGNGVKPETVHQNLIPQVFKGNGRIDDNSSIYSDFGNYVSDGSDTAEGFPVKTLGDRNLVPPDFRAKVNETTGRDCYPELKSKHCNEVDGGGGSHAKVFSSRASGHSGYRPKNHDNLNGIAEGEVDLGKFDGYSSFLRSGVAMKKSCAGKKRNVNPIAKMVSSIKLMGEEFLKVEMMKIEMAREIEKMRMEMEMKRYQFMVESQRQIVYAFANALSERKKKKTKLKVELSDT